MSLQAIREVITSYFKYTYQGNGEQIKRLFHPTARIIGSFKGEICDWSLNDFIIRINSIPTAADKKEKFDKDIFSIDHTNDAAMVKAKTLVHGELFTDYITLLKIDKKWIITGKIFTAT